MFGDVSGPPQSEISDAAERLLTEASSRGGRVQVKRGATAHEEAQWGLLNRAAERLQSEGKGRMALRDTEGFVFEIC